MNDCLNYKKKLLLLLCDGTKVCCCFALNKNSGNLIWSGFSFSVAQVLTGNSWLLLKKWHHFNKTSQVRTFVYSSPSYAGRTRQLWNMKTTFRCKFWHYKSNEHEKQLKYCFNVVFLYYGNFTSWRSSHDVIANSIILYSLFHT